MQPAAKSNRGAKTRYRAGDEPVPGYKLLEFIGEGGIGEVWKTLAAGGFEKALKIIPLRNRQGLKEFQAIRHFRHLNHPNLIDINAFWLKDDRGGLLDSNSPSETFLLSGRASELIIAMGLGEKSLADRLKEVKQQGLQGIPTLELMIYMEDAASAIDYLNDASQHKAMGGAIQHCDIKPMNILIVAKRAKLCDFGLARVFGQEAATTTTAASPFYVAPEFIQGQPSQWTDQYSLAIAYVELRTGKLPFEAKNLAEVMVVHGTGQLDLSRLPLLEQKIVKKATSMQPEKRFASASEFVRELRRAQEGVTGGGQAGRSVGAFTNNAKKSIADINPDALLAPGRELGLGYKLVKLLGRGGYGEVWEGKAPGGKACALKIVRNLDAKEGRQEFKALELMKNLENEHLIEIQAYWLIDENCDVIDDELVGTPDQPPAQMLVVATMKAEKNLMQRLKDYQRHGYQGIPLAELLRYMEESAIAIDYMNQQDILHRDIKPENLLLSKENRIKVSDFGLAKVVEGNASNITEGSVGFTYYYAASEIFRNQVTRWTDQYSLAITYYKLRTGELPFDKNTPIHTLIMMHMEGRLEFDLGVDPREAAVLRRATAVNPRQRYDSCCEMVAALREATLHLIDPNVKFLPLLDGGPAEKHQTGGSLSGGRIPSARTGGSSGTLGPPPKLPPIKAPGQTESGARKTMTPSAAEFDPYGGYQPPPPPPKKTARAASEEELQSQFGLGTTNSKLPVNLDDQDLGRGIGGDQVSSIGPLPNAPKPVPRPPLGNPQVPQQPKSPSIPLFLEGDSVLPGQIPPPKNQAPQMRIPMSDQTMLPGTVKPLPSLPVDDQLSHQYDPTPPTNTSLPDWKAARRGPNPAIFVLIGVVILGLAGSGIYLAASQQRVPVTAVNAGISEGLDKKELLKVEKPGSSTNRPLPKESDPKQDFERLVKAKKFTEAAQLLRDEKLRNEIGRSALTQFFDDWGIWATDPKLDDTVKLQRMTDLSIAKTDLGRADAVTFQNRLASFKALVDGEKLLAKGDFASTIEALPRLKEATSNLDFMDPDSIQDRVAESRRKALEAMRKEVARSKTLSENEQKSIQANLSATLVHLDEPNRAEVEKLMRGMGTIGSGGIAALRQELKGLMEQLEKEPNKKLAELGGLIAQVQARASATGAGAKELASEIAKAKEIHTVRALIAEDKPKWDQIIAKGSTLIDVKNPWVLYGLAEAYALEAPINAEEASRVLNEASGLPKTASLTGYSTYVSGLVQGAKGDKLAGADAVMTAWASADQADWGGSARKEKAVKLVGDALDSEKLRTDPTRSKLSEVFRKEELNRADKLVAFLEKVDPSRRTLSAWRILVDLQLGKGELHREALKRDFRGEVLTELKLAAVALFLAQATNPETDIRRKIQALKQAHYQVTYYLEKERRLPSRVRKAITRSMYTEILVPAGDFQGKLARADNPTRADELAELLYNLAYYKFNYYSAGPDEYPIVEGHLTAALALYEANSDLRFESHYFRGVVRLFLGNLAKVNEDLEAMRALKTSDPYISLLAAEIATAQRKTAESAKQYQEAIKNAEKNKQFEKQTLPSTFRRYARILLLENQKESLTEALRITKLMNRYENLRTEAARFEGLASESLALLGDRSKFVAAVSSFRIAVNDARNDESDNLGWYLLDLGRAQLRAGEYSTPGKLNNTLLEEAIKSLEQSVATLTRIVNDPDREADERKTWAGYIDQATYFRGIAFSVLKRWPEAQAELLKVRGVEPDKNFERDSIREWASLVLDEAERDQIAGTGEKVKDLIAKAKQHPKAVKLSPIGKLIIDWRSELLKDPEGAFKDGPINDNNWPGTSFKAASIDERCQLLCIYYAAALESLRRRAPEESAAIRELKAGISDLESYLTKYATENLGALSTRSRIDTLLTLGRLQRQLAHAYITDEQEKKSYFTAAEKNLREALGLTQKEDANRWRVQAELATLLKRHESNEARRRESEDLTDAAIGEAPSMEKKINRLVGRRE